MGLLLLRLPDWEDLTLPDLEVDLELRSGGLPTRPLSEPSLLSGSPPEEGVPFSGTAEAPEVSVEGLICLDDSFFLRVTFFGGLPSIR